MLFVKQHTLSLLVGAGVILLTSSLPTWAATTSCKLPISKSASTTTTVQPPLLPNAEPANQD